MASKVNYACTVLDKQYTTCGFRETQYMSPSKSLLAISGPCFHFSWPRLDYNLSEDFLAFRFS